MADPTIGKRPGAFLIGGSDCTSYEQDMPPRCRQRLNPTLCWRAAACLCWLGMIVAPLAAPPLRAQSQTATAPTTRETWRHSRYLNFEVISQLPDGDTRQKLREIAAVQRMVAFATGFEFRYELPCLVIFHRNKEAYLQFLPDTDTELAARTARPTAVSARKFLRGTEHTALVHFGDVYQNPYTGGANIVHNIFQQFAPRAPTWYRVGVGNLVRLTDPAVKWNPREYFTTTLQLVPPLSAILSAPLPASDALTINPSLQAPPSALGPFHHAAALFVHYGLFGDGGRHRASMLAFVRRSADGGGDEADFQACFGVGHDEIRARLRRYMESPAFAAVSLLEERRRLTAGLPTPTLREATVAQYARIKGDARILAGYSGDARREFMAAYDQGARDPELLGALGILEASAGPAGHARPFLQAAADAGVRRPMVHLELARMLYRDMRAVGDKSRVTRVQAAPVLAALEKARALKPPLAAVYQCYAVLLAEISEPLTSAELALLDDAPVHFPRDTELIFAAAKLKRDHGDVAGAAQLLGAGLRTATIGNRAKLERLRASLPAASAAP